MSDIKKYQGIFPAFYACYEDNGPVSPARTRALAKYLLDKGVEKICKKVGEEASETIIAAVKGSKEEVTYEAADLIYHLLVLLFQQGITPAEVWAELERRR